MSKKTRRKGRSRRSLSPLFGLIGGGVLLIVAALALSTGGSGGDSGTPRIAVDQDTIQYGDVKLATNLTFAVTVTNTGDGKLRFREEPYIEVRDGC